MLKVERVVFYVFLILVAGLGALIYLGLFFTQVPGAKEERLGVLEPLPEPLGVWQVDPDKTTEGYQVERRYLFEESKGLGAGTLILQVRWRDAATREIVRVEPEVLIQRRRTKPGSSG